MDTKLETEDDELAEAYVANLDLSLSICEEFASIDREAWFDPDLAVDVPETTANG